MKNFNYLSKELVDTFEFTTGNDKNNVGELEYESLGRTYVRYGKFQGVTFIGLLFNSDDKFELHVGMAIQPEDELKFDEDRNVELATENAYTDPFMVLSVNEYFSQDVFDAMVKPYIDTLDLDFIMTKEEFDVYSEISEDMDAAEWDMFRNHDVLNDSTYDDDFVLGPCVAEA